MALLLPRPRPRPRQQLLVLDLGCSTGQSDVVELADRLELWAVAAREVQARPEITIWTSRWQVLSEDAAGEWAEVCDLFRPVLELRRQLRMRELTHRTRFGSRRKREAIDIRSNLSGRAVAYI